MKSYPSITTKIDFSKDYYLFDKLDGSNIRAEWSKKQGFYKFGSRTQLLTPDQVALYPAIEYIKNMQTFFSESLSEKLSRYKYDSAVCFFEWYGPNSFAGNHVDSLDQMKATLIDVSVYKQGILNPETYVKMFSDCGLPKILHKGKITEEIFQSVRNRTLEGMTLEGVICKEAGVNKHGRHAMAKIKSNDWLNQLKVHCNGDERLFDRLK